MEWSTIASGQAGVVSRAQLVRNGYTSDAVEGLLRAGRLRRTAYAAVYQAAGTPACGEATQFTAVLGAAGVLSHLSAATWWGIEVPDDGLVHLITTARRTTEVPRNVRVHRISLDPSATTTHLHMPITQRAETLLDCIGWLSVESASTLFDRALQRRWLDADAVERRLANQPGRRGNNQLRRLLAASKSGARSQAERLMVRILKDAHVVGWRVNARIRVADRLYELDFAFESHRLAVEVDGWAHHSDVVRFRRDRDRQNELLLAGWQVLRFTWWDLQGRPDYVVTQIQRHLASKVS